MKLKVYLGISVRIIILCLIGMFWTFVTPELRDFLGDMPCTRQYCGMYDEGYAWGARHYWYFWMMFLLFIVSLVSALMQIRDLIIKEYDVEL